MDKKEKNEDLIPELRMDVESSDWVVIAKGRAFRPLDFKKSNLRRVKADKQHCVFCKLGKDERPIMVMVRGKQVPTGYFPQTWTMVVLENKFPAFIHNGKDLEERMEGNLYKKMNAIGHHELVIPKRHEQDLWKLEEEEMREFFNAYQQRYLALKEEKFVNYISIFHNSGPFAGASIAHVHSQIVTTPLIDRDLRKSISVAEEYQKTKQKCLTCDMNTLEMNMKKRVVYENENFIAICPFASKTAFEVIVSPKKHLSYFEQITEKEKADLALAFKVILARLAKALKNPDYNFYLHTSPCDGKDYRYYHWHWTILPKTSIAAGFELGTQIYVSAVAPEDAAMVLANTKI